MHISDSFNFSLGRRTAQALLFIVLTMSHATHAEGFYLSADLGMADPSESSFDESAAYRLAGGYQFKKLGLEVSIMDFDKTDYDDLVDSYVEIKGYSAHIYWRRKFNQLLGMDIGAGLFNWDADATKLGFDGGSDSDTSTYVDVRLVTEFNDTIAAYAATRYLPDISGTDIFNLSVGIKICF